MVKLTNSTTPRSKYPCPSHIFTLHPVPHHLYNRPPRLARFAKPFPQRGPCRITTMAASSSSRTKSSGPVLRSLSPSSSSRFCSYTTSKTPFSSPSPSFASSTSSTFSSPSSTFFSHPRHHHNHHHSNNNNITHHHNTHHHRAASPTRVNLYSPAPLSSGVRFSIDPRSISPNRSISNQIITKNNRPISSQKKTCMCSPTTHPGSFRCSLHKNIPNNNHHADSYPSHRLNMRRSAMKNSLVRIGGVEGEWVKRALTALIRPSSHQQRRRAGFEPRPSRLSVMSKALE